MSSLDQYREAKNTYMKLQAQAKKDLTARFHELANELLQVQAELKADFGVKLAIPTKPKARKPTKAAPAPVPEPSPKLVALEKRLTGYKQKLDEGVKAGKDVKLIKDKIYEVEDAIRLAKEA
jgi:hypothetical protein